MISLPSKTRILNLWNPIASPLSTAIATQSLKGEGNFFFIIAGDELVT